MRHQIDERDEFLLSQLLDGDLPADEADQLRRRMEQEPELRAAFDSLARVDELVGRCRDDRPAVDWTRFHRTVMDSVNAEPAPGLRTIPIARYLWLGAPLAAAAAVALLISVGQDGIRPSPPTGATPAPINVVVHAPTERAGGELFVRIHGAGNGEGRGGGAVHVTFPQPVEVAQAVRDEDQTRLARPTSVVLAATPRSGPPPAEVLELMDALPL
jgi:hypothetical protein